MKQLLKKITILIITSLVLNACSSENKRNANFLPPLSIPIATEINKPVMTLAVDSTKANPVAMDPNHINKATKRMPATPPTRLSMMLSKRN